VHLSAQEQAEVERSAIDAARRDATLMLDREDLARYMSPPVDTAFPLEYSFYLLGDLRGKTVLDYGCGAGDDAVILAAKGASVIAIDISPDLVEIAKKRAAANDLIIDYRVASAYETCLPDQSVDVAFAHAILHHLDLEKARHEMLCVLRRDGTLVVHEPVRDSKLYAQRLRMIPYHRDDVSEYEAPLKREQLDAFCAGLSCEAARRFRLPFVALAKFLPLGLLHTAFRIDRQLLKTCPFLNHFATAEVRKLKQTQEV
jgi:2-polyprenyl-3-methyl-5-hydroxy-6-metoxy-1,4-benzoquinol methylase